jgi:hypothetical protein
MLINKKLTCTFCVVFPILCLFNVSLLAAEAYDIYKLTTQIIASDRLDDAAISRCGSLALAAGQYEKPDEIFPLIIDLAELDISNNYQQYIKQQLWFQLKNGSAYPETLIRAVDIILQTANIREEKTAFLEEVLETGTEKCPQVASYAAFKLSQFSREVFQSDAAGDYLKKAVELDPLSLQANEEILSENSQDQNLEDKAKLLKLKLDLNPYDFKNSFLYAMFLRQYGNYNDAVRVFHWTADVFEHFTDEYISADIYIPWIETLNAAGGERLAEYNQIMQRLNPDTFDIRAESYRVQFDPEYSLDDFEKDITAKYLINNGKVTAIDMAWFYSFVKPEPELSFDYSKKAYIQLPALQHVRDIYTYNLMKRGDFDRVKIFLNPQNNNQAARLAMGQSHVGKIDTEMIRLAADDNPLSYEGLEAIRILAHNDTPYKPKKLAQDFNSLAGRSGPLIPDQFVVPSDAIGIEVSAEGIFDTVSDVLTVNVALENKLGKPLYIRRGGCFPGKMILSCSISGDIEIEDAFISNTLRQLSEPLMPGVKMETKLDICLGNLLEIVKQTPQAKLVITPGITLLNDIGENRLIPLHKYKGDPVILERVAGLDNEMLSENYKALSSGTSARQLAAASFFSDLYAESLSRPGYKYTATPEDLLVKSIEKAMSQNQNAVDIKVLSRLADLELPQSLESIIAKTKLASPDPAVRLLSAYLLKDLKQYDQLLKKTAQIEQNPLVKAMLTAE